MKQQISEEVQQSTVSIFGEGGGSSFCSGVLIGENETNSFILTCKHCIAPNEETLVEDNEVLHAITSVGDDLALLIVNGKIKNKHPAKLASNKPIRNQELIHIGYPSFKLYERWGLVLRTTKDWQYISLEAIGGCSGGGVYNMNKELVSILWGSFPGKNISIYEPIDDINTFLSQVMKFVNIN
jgi:S1-C subfamily serine protease